MNRKQRVATSDKHRHRAVALSALVASFVMLTFGIGYRVIATRLAAPVNAASIDSAAFERFPLQIGNWTGQDVPIDDAIVRATDTDAHINRRYSRQNASKYVGLYVAYGVRARELMPHRPEVCYPMAGWTLVYKRSVELPLSDKMQLPCRILQFSRGTLNMAKVLVLNYYIIDGQYCGDVSLLRSKASRGSGTVRYAVEVQIVTSVTNNMIADSAAKMVCDFAVESASSISGLFESIEEIRRLDESGVDANDVFGETGNG